MKTVCKKLLSLMLVAMLLVSAVPFQAFATEGETTAAPVATEAAVETVAATEEVTDVVTQPAENAILDTAYITYVIKDAVGVSPDATVKSVTTKIGSKISGAPSAAEVMTRYAQIFGSSQGKEFAGWENALGETVDMNNTFVTDLNTAGGGTLVLYAKIVDCAQHTVTFQRYDSNAGWVDVKSVSVVHGGTVAVPSGDELLNYGLNAFTINGWKMHGSDKAFASNKTTVTQDIVVRPRYMGNVRLVAENPALETSLSTKTLAVEIDAPVPVLPHPGARDQYAFDMWLASDKANIISTKADLSNVNAHPRYDLRAHGDTFYARFTQATVVYLYIHTNNNTQTATTIVPYYDAPATGTFDTNLINMYSIFSKYGDFDDKNDAAYGWYSAQQWRNYCANTAANPATKFENISTNPDYCELHIMLINNGGTSNTNANNYNNNVNTADKTNPTTGDTIFMAVTVMAVSAAALALIFFMKKRKATK